MHSFLVKNKKPICKWTQIPHGIFYEGLIPKGYDLAVCPSEGTVILDIDRHGDKNGFDYIPEHLKSELSNTLNYPTKNQGEHYWFKYTGDKILANTHSKYGIDLRTHKGYVVWYPKDNPRNYLHLIKESSTELNSWLEDLFTYYKQNK